MDSDIQNLDLTLWLSAAAILCLLLFSAFFSGTETGLTAASRGKLRALADKGNRGAQQALVLKEDSERLIGGILLGNNLANILATSLATALFTRVFGDSGVAVATLVMTVLVLVFAEVLPKTYSISEPETAAARTAPLIGPILTLLSPAVAAVRVIVRGVLTLFGIRVDPNSMLSVKEEIVGALAIGHSEGMVEKEDRDRLLGALDLGDRMIEEIMLHRSQIEMVDADAEPRAIFSQVLASTHTRLPVYKGEQENIVGVVHAKDLLREVDKLLQGGGDGAGAINNLKIMEIAKEPYFVPETTTLDDQMREFLRRHTHFALVVDEYGVLEGLITLEDILEEIVGEITDEFDTSSDRPVRRSESGDYMVDGAMTIRDLNRATDWSLPDEEANTIAGLVIHEAQTIPTPGQVFSFHGFRFEVVAREDNRLTRLKIRPL